jgi:hypothetical protein
LLNDYDEIKKEKITYRCATAHVREDKIILKNAPTSLKEYWEENISNTDKLGQLDSLKNFGIKTNKIHIPAQTTVGYKIAHNNHTKLWVDSKQFSKQEVVAGLLELNCFPLIMPVSGDIHMEADVKDFWEWLNVFQKNGIDILDDCSWGFDIKEPMYFKDHNDNMATDRMTLIHNDKPREFFENLYELHQMSKQFKLITQNTKILFVRNRIPRSLIKSNIKPKASLIAIGGGYYATGTDNLKRLLENLPKKLYYNDHQPSSWDWHDHIIMKL